jgi:SAM-dependent methyltransferase
VPEARHDRVRDPAIVRREYATEDRFLARRLTTWAELRGPFVEDVTVGALAEVAPALVLDVGCGTGDQSERIQREAGVEVVGLDPSPRMVDLTMGRGLRAVTGDAQALPFAGGTFDGVVAIRVLYHLPDLDRGLAEIARVLRPGGRLVAVTYAADHLRELWDRLGGSNLAGSPFSAETGGAALARHFRRVERRDVTGHARFHSRRSLLGCLASYGEFVDGDLGARLGPVPVPFDARYRHAAFVAHAPG